MGKRVVHKLQYSVPYYRWHILCRQCWDEGIKGSTENEHVTCKKCQELLPQGEE